MNFPTYVFAQTNWDNTIWRLCIDRTYEVVTIQCLVPLFGNIIIALVQISGVALFIMFIVAGYNFLMSGGNPKQLEKAKNTLTYAIIGVIIIVSGYLILLIIRQLTGVDVTRFEIPYDYQDM